MTEYPQGALNVDLDWGSTGIWVRVDDHWANASDYTRYDLPEWLVRRFDYWSSWYESHDPCQIDWPDAANLEAYGLSLAIDLKLFLQDTFRVFYRGAEVLPVPFDPDNVPPR